MIFLMIILVLGMNLCEVTPSCVCRNQFEIELCDNVRACPEFVKVARVECQISDIVLKTELDQLLIHGECRNMTHYARFCNNKIKEIVLQHTREHFLCPVMPCELYNGQVICRESTTMPSIVSGVMDKHISTERPQSTHVAADMTDVTHTTNPTIKYTYMHSPTDTKPSTHSIRPSTLHETTMSITESPVLNITLSSSRPSTNLFLSTLKTTNTFIKQSTLVENNVSHSITNVTFSSESTPSSHNFINSTSVTSTVSTKRKGTFIRTLKTTPAFIKQSTLFGNNVTHSITNVTFSSESTPSSHNFNMTDLTTPTFVQMTTIKTESVDSLVNEAFDMAVTAIVLVIFLLITYTVRLLFLRWRKIFKISKRESSTRQDREQASQDREQEHETFKKVLDFSTPQSSATLV